MGRLQDRICIITGGAVGLGRAFAEAMAAEGARVVIADIADGAGLAGELGGLYIRTDVSVAADINACVTGTVEEYGTVDVLVNNAAVYSSLAMQRYSDIDLDLWDRVMAVNVRGAFAMIRAVGPIMEAKPDTGKTRGKIINITSGVAYKGMENMAHYVASKGALMAMTRALSRELGDKKICVNNLAPGLTLSDSIQQNEDHLAMAAQKVIASRALKRHGYPEDLTGALIFLASDGSDFITGQTLVIDGGSVNT